jgi:hypothetical protein
MITTQARSLRVGDLLRIHGDRPRHLTELVPTGLGGWFVHDDGGRFGRVLPDQFVDMFRPTHRHPNIEGVRSLVAIVPWTAMLLAQYTLGPVTICVDEYVLVEDYEGRRWISPRSLLEEV